MKKLLGLIIKAVVAVVVAIFAIISIVAGNIVTFGMHDYAREVDVIIVLGAGLTSHGKPSPVFAERINHGIRLYQEGYAKKLMFTGGFGEGSHIHNRQKIMRLLTVSLRKTFCLRKDQRLQRKTCIMPIK